MTSADRTLTTSEYSKISGISVSTIAKMLREGKLQGRKINGKWAIDAIESQKIKSNMGQSDNRSQRKSPPAVEPTSPPKRPSGKTLDVDTFTDMTYLTKNGVRQWLKTGRLSGGVDEQGNLLVDVDNLERPEIRHLIRK